MISSQAISRPMCIFSVLLLLNTGFILNHQNGFFVFNKDIPDEFQQYTDNVTVEMEVFPIETVYSNKDVWNDNSIHKIVFIQSKNAKANIRFADNDSVVCKSFSRIQVISKTGLTRFVIFIEVTNVFCNNTLVSTTCKYKERHIGLGHFGLFWKKTGPKEESWQSKAGALPFSCMNFTYSFTQRFNRESITLKAIIGSRATTVRGVTTGYCINKYEVM